MSDFEARLGEALADGAEDDHVSTRRLLAFCEHCGSPLYACAEHDPAVYYLRIGVLEQRLQLGAPQRQIWTRRAFDWVAFPDATPSFDGQP